MTPARTIISSRLLKHPRERVWSAFENAATLERWWGPEGFTNTIKTFEFRPGGTWNLVMHGPNGMNFENTSVFEEIVPNERIVYKHLDPVHVFRMTIALDPKGQNTQMTWTMTFESAEEFEKVKDFIATANEQNLDKLENCLASLPR
ncbi:MAG TPA: SRPBCC family protein [Candidatus Peribacteria bacterium]|nr:SRPBCC family protein [Candidatus Peribacteria bacterium]